mmetsp:Transcript_125215/g.198434  ORF Transcript_125215/g.198434 Transcript_125215/m.198434 type:complete len:283 (+) Transcript_125215:51-899(+)
MGSSAQGKPAAVAAQYQRASQDDGQAKPTAPGCLSLVDKVRRCCICFGIGSLILLVALWLYGNRWAKVTLEAAGSHVTGVPVKISSVMVSPLFGQASVANFTVANPPGNFDLSPYFISCKSALFDINWIALFSSMAGLLKIDELTVLGLSMYLENRDFKSNMDVIMKNIAENPLVKFAAEHRNENQRFIIKKVKIVDLQVHTIVGGLVVPLVRVPPLEVGNIGVKQNGVSIETLVGLLIESFAVEAARHKVDEMANSMGKEFDAITPKSLQLHLGKYKINGQ